MNATTAGFWLLLAYPPLILAYDGFIHFALGKETISEYVWADPTKRVDVCGYLALWAVLLIAHLGFQFLPG